MVYLSINYLIIKLFNYLFKYFLIPYEVTTMLTNTKTNDNSNVSDWNNCPKFYLNKQDGTPMGILTLTPDSSAYWNGFKDKGEEYQDTYSVKVTKNGKYLLMVGETIFGVLNGNVDPQELATSFGNKAIKISEIYDNRQNMVNDLAMFS